MHYADYAMAETLHSMNEMQKAFRLIVVKHKYAAAAIIALILCFDC